MIGHCAKVVNLTIRLLMANQGRQPEYVKLMDFTVSDHLFLHLSLSLVKSSLAFLVFAFLWMRSRPSHSSSQHRM